MSEPDDDAENDPPPKWLRVRPQTIRLLVILAVLLAVNTVGILFYLFP